MFVCAGCWDQEALSHTQQSVQTLSGAAHEDAQCVPAVLCTLHQTQRVQEAHGKRHLPLCWCMVTSGVFVTSYCLYLLLVIWQRTVYSSAALLRHDGNHPDQTGRLPHQILFCWVCGAIQSPDAWCEARPHTGPLPLSAVTLWFVCID